MMRVHASGDPVDANTVQSVAPRGATLQNGIVRMGAHLIAIGINLLAIPFIIRNLGVESYGIIGVVNTMISYMAIATTSLTAVVGRNMTFAVENQDLDKARREISTAFFGLLVVLAIVLLPVSALSMLIERLIVIPRDLVPDARLFFVLAVLTFIVTTLSGPIGASMYVRNRLDLQSGASLARTIFFVGLIFLFFGVFGGSLVLYGVALLCGALLLLLLNAAIHRRLLPSVSISPLWFDRKILHGILSLGGWVTISQIGGLLFLQTDLFVANRVLGPKSAGQLAAIGVIPLQLRVLSGIISGLFGPTQAAFAAKTDWRGLSNYLIRSIRLTTLFFSVVVGVLCGAAEYVLKLWLGTEFTELTPVVIVLTAYLVVSLGGSPASGAILVIGNVRTPALVTVVTGVANVLLCIYFAQTMGLMGIAIVECVMLTLLNAVFVPWYVSRSCRMSLSEYSKTQLIGVASTAGIALLTQLVVGRIDPTNLWSLSVALSISAAVSILFLLPVGLRAIRQSTHGIPF